MCEPTAAAGHSSARALSTTRELWTNTVDRRQLTKPLSRFSRRAGAIQLEFCNELGRKKALRGVAATKSKTFLNRKAGKGGKSRIQILPGLPDLPVQNPRGEA